MTRHRIGTSIALTALLFLSGTTAAAQAGSRAGGSTGPDYYRFWAQAETGLSISGYNDVRSPGTTGTLFSLSEELETDPTPFIRLRLGWRISERSTLMLLAAPLTFTSTGSIDRDVTFEGTTFPAGTPLTSTYRFDSYRMTWRYAMRGSERFEWGLGATLKLRSAAITVKGGGQEAEKPNLGGVPLIHFDLAWKATPRFHLIMAGDALAAPQGRAEDVLVGARYQVSDQIQAYGGYRILEGGADVDEVYTFALINYLSAGIRIHF